MNVILNDVGTPSKKREKIRGLLMKLNVEHVAIIYGLLDVYTVISKAQHGLCKVNQFPWEFIDRVDYLILQLTQIEEEKFDGEFKKVEGGLRNGVFPEGTLISTEPPRDLRNSVGTNLEGNINRSKGTVKLFVTELKTQVQKRVTESDVTNLTRDVFHNWQVSKLKPLLQMANASRRNYGEIDVLEMQFHTLHSRFLGMDILNTSDAEMKRWLRIFNDESNRDISDILHLALCAFTKSPLEAIAESIGSVINRHGSDERSSLLPATLSNEVQLSWNGPEEFETL